MSGNSSRSINIREIERAINNIEHIESHLALVLTNFASGAELYNAQQKPIPDEYITAAELLDMCLSGCEVLSSALKGFLETL